MGYADNSLYWCFALAGWNMKAPVLNAPCVGGWRDGTSKEVRACIGILCCAGHRIVGLTCDFTWGLGLGCPFFRKCLALE